MYRSRAMASVRRSRCVSRSAESRQQPHRPTGVHRRAGGQQSGRKVRMGVQVLCVVCVCGVRVWCGAACCVTVRCAIVVKSCRASRGPPESCFVACGSSHISATGSTAATQPPAFWSWRTSSSKVSVNRSIRVHSHSPTGVCRRGESRRRGKSRSLSAALPSVGCLWNGSSSSGVFSSTSGLISGVSISPS